MNQPHNIKALIIHFKEYESFFVIQTLSQLYGKHQFMIKKNNHDNDREIIVGLIYTLTILEKNDKMEILDCVPLHRIKINGIQPVRLFAVQSLCALINSTIYNMDDVNRMIKVTPKIQLIFLHDEWFRLYLCLEFKLLLMYDKHNKLTGYDIYRRIRHQTSYGGKLITKQIAQLDLINNMWYHINDNFVIPKEQIILYKLLILENKI